MDLELVPHDPAHFDQFDSLEIIDENKIVGHVKRLRDGLFQWDIDGCGGYEPTPEACLRKAQIEYDNQQLTARRQAETAELERQSRAESGDYVDGLMSTLRRVSEELTAEYWRKARRPLSLASHEAELDKIKNALGSSPVRFRGYSIRPEGDYWLVQSPISADDNFTAPSLAKALSDINEALEADMSYDDWKLMSPEDEFEKFNPDPEAYEWLRADEQAREEEEAFELDEGRLEFSLDEAVRLLVAHYGPENTRRHVTELLNTLEEEEHARTF